MSKPSKHQTDSVAKFASPVNAPTAIDEILLLYSNLRKVSLEDENDKETRRFEQPSHVPDTSESSERDARDSVIG